MCISRGAACVLLSLTHPEGFWCPQNNTVIYSSAKPGLGTWMKQSSVTLYLSGQKIGRDTWTHKEKGLYFLIERVQNKSKACCRTIGVTQQCHILITPFTIFWSFAAAFFFFISLIGFLAPPQNSSQWWTVCGVWKDRPFIKPLLSIKKMKCSPGPHHLEPSIPPSFPPSFSSSLHLSFFCSTPSHSSDSLSPLHYAAPRFGHLS